MHGLWINLLSSYPPFFQDSRACCLVILYNGWPVPAVPLSIFVPPFLKYPVWIIHMIIANERRAIFPVRLIILKPLFIHNISVPVISFYGRRPSPARKLAILLPSFVGNDCVVI